MIERKGSRGNIDEDVSAATDDDDDDADERMDSGRSNIPKPFSQKCANALTI
jgi:hypothetical protein